MKLYHLFFLAIILLLFSCSKTNQKPSFQIGISQCSDDDWRRSMNNEIAQEASLYPNLKLSFKTAYDNNQRQIRDIESFISEGYDLIIVSPNEAIPLTPVIERAIESGIPVILVDRKINSEKYNAFVGADNFQIGIEVGVYSANLLNNKGNIVEIRGLEGSTPEIERHEGFISSFFEHNDISIIRSEYGNWLRSDAMNAMQEILKDSLKIDLIFAHNDEMAIGVYEAYKNAGFSITPPIIGIDALATTNGGIQQVINGVIDASFIYPTGGALAIEIANKILHKEQYEKENILKTAVVNRSNARVITLQTDQIKQHQHQINQLNTILDNNLNKYATQRTLLVAVIIILGLFAALIIILIRSVKQKIKAYKLLEKQNIAITTQKTAISEQRDQLIKLSKSIEDSAQNKLMFFTNVSHEFRTPPTLIYGPLETILKEEKMSPQGENLALLMRKNILILKKLVDQIADFRRYETGKMQMFFTLSDLKEYLSDIFDSFYQLSKKKRIHFSFNSTDDDFVLWYDSDKMEKICYNLLSNAFKFTPENGTIILELSSIIRDDIKYAQIKVTDNGKGIHEKDLSMIFDRYYRVDHRAPGSGIGLHLTKVLVELHNGNISVESSVNKGTVFNVTIPYNQTNISTSDEYPVLDSKTVDTMDELLYLDDEITMEENDIRDSNLPLILIVDDNASIRVYLKILLSKSFKVIEAENGQQGLLKAMQYVPELIISDVMMEPMDGFHFCSEVKENITTSHIPVILLTAFSDDEFRLKGFERGADAYIPKPFNEELLLIRVKTIIDNRIKIKEYFQKNLTFGNQKESVNDLDKMFMDKFKAIVEENIDQPELNVEYLGQQLGLSRVQLYRKIKSLTNYAPNELIRIIRLKRAEQFILNTEKSITEISYDTGFSSPSYFSKCFKDYFNESPTDYIKRIKHTK